MKLSPETAGILTPYLLFAAILGTGWVISTQLKKK